MHHQHHKLDGCDGNNAAAVEFTWSVDGSSLAVPRVHCTTDTATFHDTHQYSSIPSSPAGSGKLNCGSSSGQTSDTARAAAANADDGLVAAVAADEHAALCTYLATKRLQIDIWCSDSLLQVGTALVDLGPLLLCDTNSSCTAEAVVEVPVAACTLQTDGCTADTAAGAARPIAHLILRMINSGRQPAGCCAALQAGSGGAAPPSVSSAQQMHATAHSSATGGGLTATLSTTVGSGKGGHYSCNSSSSGGGRGDRKQLRVVHHVLKEPGSPIARELAGRAAADQAVISFEQRKVQREQLLEVLLGGGGGSGSGTGGRPQQYAMSDHAVQREGSAPAVAVQRQLLADVEAARKRQKALFIRWVGACNLGYLDGCPGNQRLTPHHLPYYLHSITTTGPPCNPSTPNHRTKQVPALQIAHQPPARPPRARSDAAH